MKLQFNAGKFEVETYTDGYPMWVMLRYEGEDVGRHIHHGEVKDLVFCLERLTAAMRLKLGTSGAELD